MRLRNVPLSGLLLGSVLALGGCPGDDSPPAEDDSSSTNGTTTDPTTTMPPDGTTTVDPPATDTDDPSETVGETEGETEGETDTDGGGFMFDPAPPEDYTQVDRVGMPAINSAVITSKDAYNMSNPAEDAAGMWVPEIVANVEGLHMALDDDLTGAGLVPCMPMDCVGQAAPLVVPDTIKIDLTGTPGFPNGRLPADPVIDVTLAVVLLDLTVMGQDALTLAGLPLNPPLNDVEFSPDFPYFAPPHM